MSERAQHKKDSREDDGSLPLAQPQSAPRAEESVHNQAGNKAIQNLVESEHLSQAGMEILHQALAEDAPGSRWEVAPFLEFLSVNATNHLTPVIRRGGEAGKMLTEIDVPAATVGNQIVLADNAPALDTAAGKQIVAHELVHVAQNQRFGERGPEEQMNTSRSEAEANALAGTVLAEGSVAPTAAAPAVAFFNPGAAIARKVAQKALKWLAKRGKNVSAHIFKRHVARRIGKSRFAASGKQVKKWITRTLKGADNIIDQGRRIVFEKQFGSATGKAGERIVRVVVDKVTGKIVTAFPTKSFLSLAAAAVGLASKEAHAADATIRARRQAIKEAEAARENWFTKFVDFFIAPSRVARDEDIIAEQRIIDKAIQEAIDAVEKEEKRSLSEEERNEVRAIILTEMETEPTAG